MKPLIVATNTTPMSLGQEISSNQHQRVDYLELSSRLNTRYLDYNGVSCNRLSRWLSEKFPLDFWQAFKVKQLVDQKGYDTVLSLSERVGIPLAFLLGPHIKHLVIMHHPLSPKKLALIKRLHVYRRWRAIIAISRAEATVMRQELNLGSEHIKVLNTPVDTNFFKPLNRVTSGSAQDHIESIGLSYRDYPTLINAMRSLPHIKCYLRVGSAWVSRDAGFTPETLPDNVEIKPYVSPVVLKECFEQSRYIVVPIRQTTQWSAGCTSVQLAQAMGRAVIATDMPGLRDYVSKNETGLLVEVGNSAAMSEAIDYLWRNPDKAESMGRRGPEWIQSNFCLDHWIDSLIQLLHTS